jgi:hypothetical protein
MTNEDAKKLVAQFVEDDKEAELTVRAVKFIADRMSLANSLCDRLFGSETACVEDVYTMYDYINRETATQLLIMSGERAVSALEEARARANTEEDLN